MKGQAEATEVILIISMTVLTFFLIMMIPKFIRDIINMGYLSNPEVVSKDLAGLITITKASTDEILIYYDVPSDLTYNIYSVDRMVKVDMLDSRGEVLKESSAPIGIDFEGSLENVKNFEIRKERTNGDYTVYVEKHEE